MLRTLALATLVFVTLLWAMAVLTAPTGTLVPFETDQQEFADTASATQTGRSAGAVITVNTTAYGVVDDSSCSLVEAILAAGANTAAYGCPKGNANAADVIVLAPDALYSLPASYASYDGATALPSITSAIIISGNGATIERNGAEHYRLLHTTFSISHSRYLNNVAPTGSAIQDDGGVGTIAYSCIVGNRHPAVNHIRSEANTWDLYLEATNNWWGTPDGPSGAWTGAGDSVNDLVTFQPYLATSILDCPTHPPKPKLYLIHLLK